jgi:hypothetical protein
MKILPLTFSAFVCFASSTAWAVTVVPLKGQTSQTIQQDTSACQSQANAQFPLQTTAPTGGRVKGATTAAVAGAAAAEVRGRQHDNVYDQIDDDVKQDYRQNQAHSAAVAGSMIGASRQRQERRQDAGATEQTITANNSVYSSCLQQRGYNVMP